MMQQCSLYSSDDLTRLSNGLSGLSMFEEITGHRTQARGPNPCKGD